MPQHFSLNNFFNLLNSYFSRVKFVKFLNKTCFLIDWREKTEKVDVRTTKTMVLKLIQELILGTIAFFSGNYKQTENMPNEKIKPLIPTLREKKRYMSFEIISRQSFDFSSVKKAIFDEYKKLFGEKGFGEAGLIMLSNKYFEDKKSGIIRLTHTKTESLRVVIASIQKINGHDVVIKSITTSGMLNKAEKSINLKSSNS